MEERGGSGEDPSFTQCNKYRLDTEAKEWGPRVPFTGKMGTRGPYFASILGVPGAQYHGDFGDPLVKMGIPVD